MENTEKAKVMQWHYNQLGQDAPFMLRASGKFEWFDGHAEPDESTVEQWKVEMEKSTVLQAQESELLRLIAENEYHLTSVRKKMVSDRDIWVGMLDTWDDELTIVKGQLELLREGKDPGQPITITAKPVLNGD